MDGDTYRQAVLTHKNRVFGYAVRLLGDRDDARDVAQEALMRLWEHREKVPELAAARAWLLKTAHRLCVDRARASAWAVEPEQPAPSPVAASTSDWTARSGHASALSSTSTWRAVPSAEPRPMGS